MGSENQDQSKKCFCAKCFLPINPDDRVEIDGQNFHRFCSTCCVCRCIPTSLKMFYGHVFCNECFKSHILSRFKGECPKMQSNGWWMHWGPNLYTPQSQPDSDIPKEKAEAEDEDEKKEEAPPTTEPQPEPCTCKKCICMRCLQPVDEKNKIVIDGKDFHAQCAKCCVCHTIPTSLKIYYGQVFCDECFQRHVVGNNNGPTEFFKTCFEQWRNNPQFADGMKEFMGSSGSNQPVFIMPSPLFCRCGANAQEWYQKEPKKSLTAAPLTARGESAMMDSSWDLSYEHGSEVTESSKNCEQTANHVKGTTTVNALEKIEKLTKFLRDENNRKNNSIKWRNFLEQSVGHNNISAKRAKWVDYQAKIVKRNLKCPKCLWQLGPVSVNSILPNELFCIEN